MKIPQGCRGAFTALLYPRMYDDIECPCVFELNDGCYTSLVLFAKNKSALWFAPEFMGKYHSFHDDGYCRRNYAARTVQDGPPLLIVNFFYVGKIDALPGITATQRIKYGR
ncbi:MAG: hypothetical protein IPJ20_17780 [Flammeovirgaceae bacterium]|nr:hypothetical protein [Flammeovirgaceae bacterium]